MIAPAVPGQSRSCRLSVNVNKIALLRNARDSGVPSVLHFAEIALEAGASGGRGLPTAPTSDGSPKTRGVPSAAWA